MADVPVLGTLTPWAIRSEMGVKSARGLETLVSKVVRAAAVHGFGRTLMEAVYLAGFEHGALMMERRMSAQAGNHSKQEVDEVPK